MVFQHCGARDFDLGGGFHYSGSYPIRRVSTQITVLTCALCSSKRNNKRTSFNVQALEVYDHTLFSRRHATGPGRYCAALRHTRHGLHTASRVSRIAGILPVHPGVRLAPE